MRILYMYQYFVTRSGSGMTRAYEFAYRLQAMGHDVTVVSLPGYLPEAYHNVTGLTELDIDGVNVLLLPVKYAQEMSFVRRVGAFVMFALWATWVCMRRSSDVIYASSGPLTIALPAIIGSRWQRIPMVFEVRDLWPEMPIAIGALRNPAAIWLARWLEWIAYHAAAHVVALSPGQAEGVLNRDVPDEKVSVIPNCADLDIFAVPADVGQAKRAELGISPNQPLVVYTGSFGLMNNVGYLVDVAYHMRKKWPEVHFLLIGKGAEFDNVYEKAQACGVLGENVTILEPQPKTEMPKILSAATIATVIFLPIKEMWNNSANKFFDALAAGRPVAINYGGWQAALIEEKQFGVQLDDTDTPLAAEQLAGFLADPARVATAGEAAQQLARERYDRDDMAAQLEAILREVTR